MYRERKCHYMRFSIYKKLCAGGGCFSPSELNLFRSLGLQDHIVQLNEISDSVLAMLYENSEAFIFPSLDEGFGLPIIEAISCKANVLASDIPVFKEIGEDMIKYFDPRNTDSLVFALESCVSSKVNSETLEFRSEIVKNKYRWEKCAQETVDVYNQTTNEKNLKKDN